MKGLEKLRLSFEDANEFISSFLATFSDIISPSIELIRLNDGYEYAMSYVGIVNGESVTFYKQVTSRDYNNLLRYGLECKGYNVANIKPKIDEDGISFKVEYSLLDRYSRKRKK